MNKKEFVEVDDEIRAMLKAVCPNTAEAFGKVKRIKRDALDMLRTMYKNRGAK
jgi:hypothetical protein